MFRIIMILLSLVPTVGSWLAKSRCHPYKKRGANSSTIAAGKDALHSSRRGFLQSLSRTALVLSLEGVLELARPAWLHAFPQAEPKKTPGQSEGDLGVSFLEVGRESGLSVKTIFGGEHKNKYLLETTGCGVAFYDYDNDGWLDIFLVNGTRLEGYAPG